MERRRQILLAFLTAVLFFSSLCLFSVVRLMRTEQEYYSQMAAADEEIVDADTETDSFIVTDNELQDDSSLIDQEPVDNEWLTALSNENEDFAAWLCIDGTHIDYPVMMTPDRPDYYLRRSFTKEKSVSGTPYIANECDLGSNNILIYGHNMKNGTMFSDLLLFKDESFYKSNSTISLDTVKTSSNYEIIAVFPEKVHYKDEKGVFRYYEYAGELDEKRFNEYLTEIKERSLYDTGNAASYGDRLITLSTCAYHTENGRFVIVAADRRNADNLMKSQIRHHFSGAQE